MIPYLNNRKEFNYLSRILTIGKSKVNEDGVFTVCSILNEILMLNDDIIIGATGSLDYKKTKVAWHYIEFMNKVFAGDTLLFEARSVISNEVSLEIEVVVRKKNNGKTVVVAKGHFVFKIQRLKALATILEEEKIYLS